MYDYVAVVTGGAGFIGSSLVRYLLLDRNIKVITIDKLTYAGNITSISDVIDNPNHTFIQMDIGDRDGISSILNKYKPDLIFNLAAESHVDNSIDEPTSFINTNVLGTFNLLECVRKYYNQIEDPVKTSHFRFHHVSTDEVYGDLTAEDDKFREDTRYDPSSPYSASKAASDHLVRAWYRTYGLPISISNCSNNYGPYHFPEKLIPLTILKALKGENIPVYGDGQQIRDWLFVEDHVEALYLIATNGLVGSTYNVGGNNEATNFEIVTEIIRQLIELNAISVDSVESLITYVEDRPGHDRRYAVDASKLNHELGWSPKHSLSIGLKYTIEWFLSNEWWWSEILSKKETLSRRGIIKQEDVK